MGLSVWRETSKTLTVYRVCYTPIETLLYNFVRAQFEMDLNRGWLCAGGGGVGGLQMEIV